MNTILQLGPPYRGAVIMETIERDYSIVKWSRSTDAEQDTITITYTDDQLITFWLLKWV